MGITKLHNPVLGLVTIGQAPRTDLIPDIAHILGDTAYVECGALDDLGPSDFDLVAPRVGEAPLISRMRDGSSVTIGHAALHPLLERAIFRCEEAGAAAVLVLCTGNLGEVRAKVPVFYAERLAQMGVRALTGGQRVGIVSPLPGQVAEASARWERLLQMPVLAEFANPYSGDVGAVGEAAARLASGGAQWIFLDCIGYTEEMRAVARAAGVPVLLARAIAARLALEAVAGWPDV
jgi:protein AroM